MIFICMYTINTSSIILLIISAAIVSSLCFNITMPSAKTRRLRDKQRYASAKEDICTARKEYYRNNSIKCKEASQIAYANSSERKKRCL